jgi:putative ABC transport system permease protein
MFLRVLGDSLLRQKRRKGVALAAVALGTTAATALAAIGLDVGDRINRELKSFGANLVVLPRGGSGSVVVGGEDLAALSVPAYLPADEIMKVKDNFWKNNILGFAPILDVPARVAGRRIVLRGAWFERAAAVPGDPTEGTAAALTGLRVMNPYWSVEGRWPDEPARPEAPGVLVGRALAQALGLRPGDPVTITIGETRRTAEATGILSAGGDEDGMALAPLEWVQAGAGLPDRLSRVLVTALTTPENAVWERLGKNPRDLPPAEFEKWTCTPFVSSIAYEIERSWPGSETRVIRRVASAEGAILARSSGLMTLVAILAGFGAALTVSAALTTGVLERRVEIGLLKAMGAGDGQVVALFLAEASAIGLLGGVLGAGAGAILARALSAGVFGAPVSIRPIVLPLAVALALVITLVGSLLPARRIAGFRPAEVLRGR